MTYESRHSALAASGVAARLGVARPLHVEVVEDGVGVNLVGRQDHLEGVGLVEGYVDATGEGHVLPGDDDRVLRLERVGPDDALADVPGQALAHLHAELVRSLLQVPLQSVIRWFRMSFFFK